MRRHEANPANCRPVVGRATRQFGFSLIEIMVALALGMLIVIIAMQVFATFEGSKRTTTGGADAASNGASALYLVERDAGMAGWGLETSLYQGRTSAGNPILPGCATLNHYCSGNAKCSGADWSLAPLSITDGGNGPDTLTMRYFANPDDGNFVPASTAIVYSNAVDANAVPQLKLSSNFGCRKGDLVLVVSDPAGSACTLVQVSDTPGTASGNYTLAHLSGAAAASAYNDPEWDPAVGKLPDVVSNQSLATCFTPAPAGPSYRRIYSIDTGKGVLMLSGSGTTTAANAVADGIVDLQAQYGIAADGSQTVSSWVDATTAEGWDSPEPKAGSVGATTSNRLQNIKAVRIALLARSAQYEKPSGSACDATGGNPGTPGAAGWSAWATFDTSNTAVYPAATWRCYRYRAFEIIVPMRNVIWGSS
jgi:type IV pilus assembly protein PilW